MSAQATVGSEQPSFTRTVGVATGRTNDGSCSVSRTTAATTSAGSCSGSGTTAVTTNAGSCYSSGTTASTTIAQCMRGWVCVVILDVGFG